jgi:DNA invertase Pin-like site-specific DNA recombinase
MMKVALYARSSTTEGLERQFQAMENSLEPGTEAVRYGDLTSEPGVLHPRLAELLSSIGSSEFDVVLTWSLDRLSRNLDELLRIQARLAERGVRLQLNR